MKRRDFLGMAMVGAASLALPSCATSWLGAKKRPNIILIYTDDQGYADLGAQNVLKDIKTPHLDALAADGVRCTSGYITAPQCAPSRAGLMTGIYQQRFDMEHIPEGPLPMDQTTLADLLGQAGYVTGMVGKWHLEPNVVCREWGKKVIEGYNGEGHVPLTYDLVRPYLPDKRGFQEVFHGEMQRYWANFNVPDTEGIVEPRHVKVEGYRLDIQTEAALDFLKRNGGRENPFFLYLAYFAPHVPPEAIEKYLARFPGEMPERRRYALAMMAAIDDGVGRIRELLEKQGEYENTLFFFISDNGAPIHHKIDKPISFQGGAWDGSLNAPLTGEKGTLMEGGIRVPFFVTWKNQLPAGQVFDQPISALDVMPICLSVAGVKAGKKLDGIDMLPALQGKATAPNRALYWRFWGQAAIREGKWKYISLAGKRSLLFDLEASPTEKENLVEKFPEKAAELHQKLKAWADQMDPPGLPTNVNAAEKDWYQYHLDYTI